MVDKEWKISIFQIIFTIKRWLLPLCSFNNFEGKIFQKKENETKLWVSLKFPQNIRLPSLLIPLCWEEISLFVFFQLIRQFLNLFVPSLSPQEENLSWKVLRWLIQDYYFSRIPHLRRLARFRFAWISELRKNFREWPGSSQVTTSAMMRKGKQ